MPLKGAPGAATAELPGGLSAGSFILPAVDVARGHDDLVPADGQHLQSVAPRGVAWLRRRFTVTVPPASARLWITALGIYEAELNGARVGQDILAPGWTSYRNRVKVQRYEVSHLLVAGENVLGVWLADGWFRGQLGWKGGDEHYGARTALAARLVLTAADGTETIVSTDDRWRSARSPITSAGLYDGERFDARSHDPAWSTASFDDSHWNGVVVSAQQHPLVPDDGPPLVVTEAISCRLCGHTPSGAAVYDAGQNISGRVRIRLRGARGARVRLEHAEVLEPDGALSRRPLRSAAAADEYILRGDAEETWQPRFTTHGFRFVSVESADGPVELVELTAEVIHSEMQRRGWFRSSDPALNRFHDNVVWSLRGNFAGLPTDCPQRDERLGWTGDIAAFAPTSLFLYDTEPVLSSWLTDLALEQREYGSVPFFVPWVDIARPRVPAAAWCDAATIVPWAVYQESGDLTVLARQYESMTGWVDEVAGLSGPDGLWRDHFQFGDWLDPTAPADAPALAKAHADFIANAYQVHSLRIVSQAAHLLGHRPDAERYADRAAMVADALRAAYLAADGTTPGDAAAEYAIGIVYDLFPAPQRAAAGRRLAELVRAAGHRIMTGFVGTQFVCDALDATGHRDDAVRLVLQREAPSWLATVERGATTIWERWDSMLADGSVNPGWMTSFNHYAFGSVADYLHRRVAGLAPASPGWRTVLIDPYPGDILASASAAHLSPQGMVSVAWEHTGTTLAVRAAIPPGMQARLRLPGRPDIQLEAGTVELSAEL